MTIKEQMMINKTSERDWYMIDANEQVLGRVATEIATLLRGKNKPTFASNLDGGAFVVVINANKVILTGRKEEQKRYYRHSGYLGNLKTETVEDLRRKKPTEMLKIAVRGMLPRNRLKQQFMMRLKLFAGKDHTFGNIKFATK